MTQITPRSFTIDHTTLQAGVYYQGATRITRLAKVHHYDLRFKTPSEREFMEPRVLHTIEHLFAYLLREDRKNKVVKPEHVVDIHVYGCKTGFGLILSRQYTERQLVKELQATTLEAIEMLKENMFPGMTEKECGNPYLRNGQGAIAELKKFLKVLDVMQAQHHKANVVRDNKN